LTLNRGDADVGTVDALLRVSAAATSAAATRQRTFLEERHMRKFLWTAVLVLGIALPASAQDRLV